MRKKQRWLVLLVGLTVLVLSVPRLGWAQGSADLKALKAEIESLKREFQLYKGLDALKETLKEGQTAIQRELQEIKNLLRAGQAPPRAAQAPEPGERAATVLSIDGDPVKGDPNAKLTLFEFTDYQCPFCARHFRDTMPQIEGDYIKTGKVKYVVREFPLEAIHPNAFKAAEAANCAGDQGKYWEMHDLLFQNQRALGAAELPRHAETLGLEMSKFQQCLESGKFAAKIREDQADGQKAGVTGTPSFFLGVTEPNSSTVKVVQTIKGAVAYPAFQQAIDSVLSSQR